MLSRVWLRAKEVSATLLIAISGDCSCHQGDSCGIIQDLDSLQLSAVLQAACMKDTASAPVSFAEEVACVAAEGGGDASGPAAAVGSHLHHPAPHPLRQASRATATFLQ